MDLDTSRCYMGKSRFNKLLGMLPDDQMVIGIDEHTGLIFDFKTKCLHVIGLGTVTIIKDGNEQVIPTDSSVDFSDLGEFDLSDPLAGISEKSWSKAQEIQEELKTQVQPSPEVIELAQKRETARKTKEWEEADQIRGQIESKGWIIQDTADGYLLEKKP
jgi:hypothetical protein